MQQVSKEEIRGGPRFGGCQLWGASLTGERPLSGGRPAILRAALRTDAQRIADRYTWRAAWPRAAVFAACRPAPVVAQDPAPVFDCAAAGLILSVFAKCHKCPKINDLRRYCDAQQAFFNGFSTVFQAFGLLDWRLPPRLLRVRSQDQRDLTTPQNTCTGGYFV